MPLAAAKAKITPATNRRLIITTQPPITVNTISMRLSIARSLHSKLGSPAVTATTRTAVASYSTLPSRHEVAASSSSSSAFNNKQQQSTSSSSRKYTTYSQLPSEHQMVYEMCRKFAEEELMPNAGKWDQKHEFPTEAVDKLVSR
jgi:hypothetical protein